MSLKLHYKKYEIREDDNTGNALFSRSRNITKATIRLEQLDGKTVVIKDYSNRNFLIRIYGNFTLRREERAYSVLSGIKGIPHCYGLNGKNTLVFECIPGRPLSQINRKKAKLPIAVFDELDRIISAMHSRGVANSDLHGSNILVTETGDVFIVDFASAVFAKNLSDPGYLASFFMKLDHYAAARIRARYLGQPKPKPVGSFGFAYNMGRLFKTFLKRVK
ncbi:MAG: hypothetical protein DRH24_16710 [Deltaproteobacteria bacterium]|nr:MAG: hypothetical protein DRH24_16710 [Deltaproteobacteria bacterium]